MTMKKIAAEVRNASTRLSTMRAHGRRPRPMPITSAPNTPSPAASVMVTNPPKIPPITTRNSRSVAHTSLRLFQPLVANRSAARAAAIPASPNRE